MKLLVIPDVHLKPKMFERATKIMESKQVDGAVVLGDLVDDWRKTDDIVLYQKTLQAATEFAKKYKPYWCWGNHDFSYLYELPQSGYSFEEGVADAVRMGLFGLSTEVRPQIAHLIDNTLFSHAGLTEIFANRLLPLAATEKWDDIRTARLLSLLEDCSPEILWLSSSPLWARPQEDYNEITGECIDKRFRTKMWREADILQVVGHTPMHRVTHYASVLSTDVFSTYPTGTSYGEERFIIVDTVERQWEYAQSKRGGGR